MSHWPAIFEGGWKACLRVPDSDICLLSRQRSGEAREGENGGKKRDVPVLQAMVLMKIFIPWLDGNSLFKSFNLAHVRKEAKTHSRWLSTRDQCQNSFSVRTLNIVAMLLWLCLLL